MKSTVMVLAAGLLLMSLIAPCRAQTPEGAPDPGPITIDQDEILEA